VRRGRGAAGHADAAGDEGRAENGALEMLIESHGMFSPFLDP
jgi:hypothetical protein